MGQRVLAHLTTHLGAQRVLLSYDDSTHGITALLVETPDGVPITIVLEQTDRQQRHEVTVERSMRVPVPPGRFWAPVGDPHVAGAGLRVDIRSGAVRPPVVEQS